MKIFFLCALFLFCDVLIAENYKQIKLLDLKESDLIRLSEYGLPLEEIYRQNDGSLLIFLSDSEFERIKNSGLKYEIIIDDWFDYYKNLPKMSKEDEIDSKERLKQQYNVEGFGYGSMGGFYTMEEVYNKIDDMYSKYPELITKKFSIGNSIEGRPIYGVKISDNPTSNENEPQVLYTALIHGREPESMMVLMCYMYYMLENYGIINEVTYLVNNRELLFIPIINVDGYEYNRIIKPNGGGMWRHNRRINPDSTIGVDLNRNFGYKWGCDNIGSSPIYGDETYRGEAPFSEPETQAIRDFCNANNISTAVFNHSYYDIIYFPWEYIMQPTPDNDIFSDIASMMASYNKYGWRIPSFQSNGDANDWMYGETTTKNKIFSFTIEIGNMTDGMWPKKSRIFPLAKENIIPNLILAWVASGYVKIVNHSFNCSIFKPGDIIKMSIAIKNIGLLPATNFSLVLSTASQNIIFKKNQINISSVPGNMNLDFTDCFCFAIRSSAPQGNIVLKTSVLIEDTLMSEYKTTIKVDPIISNIDEDGVVERFYSLRQNFPNPFNQSTTIYYYLASQSQVKLTVINILGETVDVLVNSYQNAGNYAYSFDASSLPSGIYYYQLTAGDFRESKKMILLK